MCSSCILNNSWNNSGTGDCRICGVGLTRMRSWTAAHFKNPLREFLDWIINKLGFERSGRTYAISHYGGFVTIILFYKFSLVDMICIYY